MTENLYTPNCIRTYSGIYMNVFEPTAEMICIEDIAHALSHLCRFGGHTPQFYSVAQHSYICAHFVSDKGRLQALMHDASEAYLLDIPSPIKKALPGYKIMEDKLMQLISRKYKFSYPLTPEVKKADQCMLEVEWNKLVINKDKADQLECWAPDFAKNKFLEMFRHLTN